MKLDLIDLWKNNIDKAMEMYEGLYSTCEKRGERITTLEERIIMLKVAKDRLLGQTKHISLLNGQLIRERNDMEDKLIEATKPWYSKLFVWKKKLFKLSIRNPFYLES